MSSNPIDPRFSSASYSFGDIPPINGNAVDYGLHDDPAVESASSELGSIAGAIESLQNRLSQAQDQLNNVAAVQTTEFEIGRLFVEAQRFSEASLSKLEIQIQEILIEAEAKAAEILREATEEAAEIRRQAHQSSSIPNRAAEEVQTAIVGFANVNSQLVRELAALSDILTTSTDGQSPSGGRLPGASNSL
jgi:chromosome segregation ATPase